MEIGSNIEELKVEMDEAIRLGFFSSSLFSVNWIEIDGVEGLYGFCLYYYMLKKLNDEENYFTFYGTMNILNLNLVFINSNQLSIY